MYSLITGCWNQFFEKPTYKLLIVGMENTGKTVIK